MRSSLDIYSTVRFKPIRLIPILNHHPSIMVRDMLTRRGMGLYSALLYTYSEVRGAVETRDPELLAKFDATFRSSSLSSAAD
jgi:hypothetical protein